MPEAVAEFEKTISTDKPKMIFSPRAFVLMTTRPRMAAPCIDYFHWSPYVDGQNGFMCNDLAQMMAGIKVYFFTLEMPRSDMIARLVSIQTRVPLLDILQRRISDEQARQIVGALPSLSALPGAWSEEGNLKQIDRLFAQIEPGVGA